MDRRSAMVVAGGLVLTMIGCAVALVMGVGGSSSAALGDGRRDHRKPVIRTITDTVKVHRAAPGAPVTGGTTTVVTSGGASSASSTSSGSHHGSAGHHHGSGGGSSSGSSDGPTPPGGSGGGGEDDHSASPSPSVSPSPPGHDDD
jgi:hypothetical protein